jgi:hypothetical protein
MKAVISRTYGNTETQGHFVAFDGHNKVLELVTIELPDNGNQKNVSCIHEGVYQVSQIVRPNGDKAYLVYDVPGRDAILIHKGNYVAGKKVDSEGCILPGLYFTDVNNDGFVDVAESTVAMNRLLNVMGERFELHII